MWYGRSRAYKTTLKIASTNQTRIASAESRGREGSLRPERLERFLVFIEQPSFDDPVVLDPQEEEMRLLEDPISALPDRGRQCRGMHVAREDVDELRAKRPTAQLREFREVREDRLVSAVIPRDLGRARDVPHRVLRDELLQGLPVARVEGRVQSLDEGRIRVLEHPHCLTS